MTIHARFLPKYPKRIQVADGLTKTEANGVVTLGFDYAGSEFGVELTQAVDAANADATATAADRTAVAADKTAADAAKVAAEAARDVAIATNSTFANKAAALAFAPTAAPDFIRLEGYTTAGIGGALYKKVAGEPSHAGKFSITLSDAVTVVWYEISEKVLTEVMFGVVCDGDWAGGGTDNATALQNWASCPVSLRKEFTGCAGTSAAIEFLPGTIIDMNDLTCGIDGSRISVTTTYGVIRIDQSSSLVQINTIASNMTSRTLLPMGTDDCADGDYLCIYNPTDYSWANYRTTYRAGEWLRVGRRDASGYVVPTSPTRYLYNAADVVIYRLRGPQVILRGFRVQAPYLEMPAIFIDCSISPIVENITASGAQYANILLQRCITPYVNCDLYELEDTTSPGDEYALVLSSCYAAEIHGNYHSQRHGIACGNSDFVCCVPNRDFKIYASTYSYDGIGSLDIGHGGNEGHHVIGGSHSGIALGGANHTFVGLNVTKEQGRGSSSTAKGLVISGSEYVGGEFKFIGCNLRSDAKANDDSNGAIDIRLVSGVSRKPIFVFDACTFDNSNGANAFFINVLVNGCLYEPGLIVTNPRIIDPLAAITIFAWLQYVSGATNFDIVSITGETGLSSTQARCVSGFTASKWKFDPQYGTISIPGNTGSATSTAAVVFGYAYPATPFITCSNLAASIGGDAYTCYPQSPSGAGFSATARTADSANFADTSAGDVRWRAEF